MVVIQTSLANVPVAYNLVLITTKLQSMWVYLWELVIIFVVFFSVTFIVNQSLCSISHLQWIDLSG